MNNLKEYISHTLCICFLGTIYLATAKTITVTAIEYGEKWSFTVSQGVIECKANAIIMHTSRGTYSISGAKIIFMR